MKISRRAFAASIFIALNFSIAASAYAKDQWLQVRSKNFLLIGNAAEKDIRKVATKLEQFRETFRIVFTNTNLTSPIPTNVIVFKSDSNYRPFKPKRSDGKIDDGIAGYFQSGEDVNYITLSAGGPDADTFGTIFHEYVHSILDTNYGSSEVPKWFNEGLAEYYQTFEIEGDQIVRLGLPQNEHLLLLQQSRMIPLNDLFRITARELGGGHSRNIFYAQSWALVHYLIQTGKTDGLGKFLSYSMKGIPREKAFQDAFAIPYSEMELELKKYVGQSRYKYHSVKLKEKLVFDSDMKVSPLTESESQAFLGDLLYHNNRADDAEPYLRNALALDPVSSMANTSLGMVKIRQRRYADAKAHLEKAVSLDPKGHLAYYRLAYLLSRESRDEFGFVSAFTKETSTRMLELLRKAIALKPDFTESHELFAFVSVVNNEDLDEAIGFMQSALKYQPGNERYRMRIAELYLRQKKFDDATQIAERIASTSEDESIKSRAQNLVGQLKQIKEIEERNAAARKQYEQSLSKMGRFGERPILGRRIVEEKPLSDDEIAKLAEESTLRSLNRALRKPEAGEKQILGSIQKIECRSGIVNYMVNTGDETLTLTSKGFQSLILTTYVEGLDNLQLGCDSTIAKLRKVLTFKPAARSGPIRGELVAIDFVPENFRFVDVEKPDVVDSAIGPDTPSSTIVVQREDPTAKSTSRSEGVEPPNLQDLAEIQRTAMFAQIQDRLRKPEPGEKRGMGTIERSECTPRAAFFYLISGGITLKFLAPQDNSLKIGGYTPEIEDLQIGCGMKSVDVPVVFVYKDSPDKKTKSVGLLVSLEFVPKSFVLQN